MGTKQNVEIGLIFTADTGNAKTQLRELKKNITDLYNSTAKDSMLKGYDPKMQSALNSAAKLKVALEEATNVDTGRLDLSKFSRQVEKGQIDLKKLATDFIELGPEGEKAFMQLAQSIVVAEAPIKRVNTHLANMWKSLKNAAGWKISSAIVEGFTNSVQEAYRYAQDLDETLNDIRVVSGQNADEMAKFAKEANKAAKQLSTTTNEYAKASLIYYQQGLSDAEIKERTDVTVKMANVVKESAETVSDQMTAVWNNFYEEGGKSLEYYGDVMVKLGADTASSTDEIAAGLEKFAAVTDTIGLSFEYAASALTTITAKTRESADTVGTALKTIFSRIEGLSLGETLDDGTDLNKYSEALAVAGVNIKDANGELRDMDEILDDLGSRWQTLGRDEQVALAQAVAGVRQYNQLIALMDNWDFFQQNLATSYNATGALNEQQEIYAEGWEAARDKVTAALETIYDDLIDEDFFIMIDKMLAGSLELIDKLINTLGGLPGVLSAISMLVTKIAKDSIKADFSRIVENVRQDLGLTENSMEKTRRLAVEAIDSFNKGMDEGSAAWLEGAAMKQQVRWSHELQQNLDKISETEAGEYKEQMRIAEAFAKRAVEAKRASEEAEKAYSVWLSKHVTTPNMAAEERMGKISEFTSMARQVTAVPDSVKGDTSKFKASEHRGDNGELTEEVLKYGEYFPTVQKKIEAYNKALEESKKTGVNATAANKAMGQALAAITREVKKCTKGIETDDDAIRAWAKSYVEAGEAGELTVEQLIAGVKAFQKTEKAAAAAAEGVEAYKDASKNFPDINGKGAGGKKEPEKGVADGLVAGVESLTSFATALNTFKAAYDTVTNSDLSFWERFSGAFSSLIIAVPSLVSGIKDFKVAHDLLNDSFSKGIPLLVAHALGVKVDESMLDKQGKTTIKNILSTKLSSLTTEKDTVEKGKNTVMTWLLKIANDALNGSLTENLALAGIIIGVILLVGAAIAGIIFLVQAATRGEKEHAATLEDLSTQAAEATAALDSISSSFDDLASKRAALDDLTEGTAEWRKALLENNKAVIDLIASTEGLSTADLIKDSRGVYSITQGAQERVLNDAVDKAAALQVASARANAQNAEQEFSSQFEDETTGVWGKLKNSTIRESYLATIAAWFQEANPKTQNDSIGSDQGTLEYSEKMTEEQFDRETEFSDIKDAFNSLDWSGGGPDLQEAATALKLSLNELSESQRLALQELIQDRLALNNNTEQLRIANQTAFSNEMEGLGEGEADLAADAIESEKASIANDYIKDLDWEKTLWGGEKDQAKKLLGLKDTDELKTVTEKGVTRYIAYDAEGNEIEDFGTITAIKNRVSEQFANALLRGEDVSKWTTITGKTANNYYQNYSFGTNKAEEIAKQYDFGFDEGLAAVLFNNGVNAGTITQENAGEVAKGIRIIANQVNANGEGELTSEVFETNKNDIKDWYDSVFGEGSFEKDGEDKILKKINELIKDNADKVKELDKTQADTLANSAVSDGLIETTDAFWAYADAMVDAEKRSKLTKKELAQLTKQMLKNASAAKKATAAMEDYEAALESGDEVAKANALSDLATALNEIFGTGAFDATTVFEQLENIKKALNGDTKAFNDLQVAVAKNLLISAIGDDLGEIEKAITELSNLETVEVGDKITVDHLPEVQQSLLAYCNSVAQAAYEAGKTSDEAAELVKDSLAAMGFAAEDLIVKEVDTGISTPEGIEAVISEQSIPWAAVSAGAKGLKDIISGSVTGVDFNFTPGKKKTVKNFVIANKNQSFTKTSESFKAPPSTGSGSSSKPSKVTKSKKSDVVDRYKEVTDKIDDVTDSLDKASEAADRLYGKARIKAMEEQIALMEKENKLLAQKRKEAESYLKIDKSALNKAAKEAGVSLTYDSLGNITNYTTQMTKLYNQLAAAQDKMNSFSSKDAQDEFQEATLDPLQEKIDNLKEALSQYEETRELIEDLNAEIRSNKNEIEDLQFETFQHKIELKIEIDERSLNYIEYQLDKIEDKAFAAAERVRLIGGSGSKIESLYNQVQTNQKAINDIMADNLSKNDKKLFDAGDIDKINWQSYINNGTFLESEVDALKEYADNLLDLNQELQEALDLVHEQLTNAFDEWNDEIAEGVELFDHYGSIVDYMSEMVELTAGLAGYSAELNKTIAEVRTTAAQERADAAAQVLADQQAARDLLQSKINDTDWFSSLSEEERQRWLDNLDEAEAAVRQAEEDLFSATSEAMSAAMEKFQATFTAILRDVEKTMTEAGSFDEELSQLERQEEIAERTLAAYQEIYELSKLNRDVLNSIDETDNIKAKEALREIQEEILEKQADGQKMSQYELDYLRKKYELRLAEIALEEAQNAKSKVRMSRDNEGNWGYVYTADQDKIDEARQNYEDKLYEITELTTNYADEVSRSLLETQQQYQEAMQNLADQAAEGYFESEEEYQQAVRELTEYHQGLIDFQLDELEKATENSNYLYTQEWQNYKFSTGNKIASDEDFRNSFQETYAAQISGYKSAAQFAEDWRKATTKAAEKAAESYSVLANDMNTSLKNLGTTLGELNGDFNKYLKDDKNSIINKTNEAKDTIVKTSQTARDALVGKNGLLGAMATLATEWDKKVSAIVKKTEGLVKAVDAANAKLTGEEEKKKSSSSSSSNNSKNSSTSSGGKTQGNGKIEVGDSVGVVNGATWYYDSYGTSPTGVAHAGRIKYINLKGTHPYNIDGLGWVKKEDITGYASGGYTGKWGQEGKLALLHEKELVLNKEDTENFLAGMKLLENITKFISLRSILPDTSKLEFGGKNVVEQDVTIHADFPNVSDHNEIELALSNLVNAASQYAFSKK